MTLEHTKTGPLCLALMLLLSTALAACSSKPSQKQPDCRPLTQLLAPENAITKELMASLGQAQNFHAKADVLVDSGKLAEAADTVAMILTIPFPKGAPEAEDVMADTRARLAKLRIDLGQLDEAMDLVDEGIATATRPSFYQANLHTVRGQVFQAMATRDQAGPEPDAEQIKNARHEAIQAFDRSIQINKALLEEIDSGDTP